jgi:hypothetical protein
LAVQVSVSIEETGLGGFSLFPNPSSQQVHIQIPESIHDFLFLQIHNDAGILVQSHAIGFSKLVVLNEQDFPSSGAYYITIINQDNKLIHHEKIIRCE